AQPDGFFPARSPEPKPETLTELCNVTRQLGADIGIAYDGDGDRMAAVNEKGVTVPQDLMLAAYSRYIVKNKGGGTIITHVDASRCIEEAVKPYGGKVIRTPVGDVNIALAIKKHNAVFGGEPVGSWIHPKHHFCPDGILSSALLLQALEEENKTLSQFVSGIREYPLLRDKVHCPNELKQTVMKKIQKAAPAKFPKILNTLTVDGLRFELTEGWIVIRPSGTEPAIRVTVEAKTEEEAKRLLDKALSLIRHVSAKD
ncbi:MAG TPA: phosphoglucosamine mutase, partial [archaeon]|nr:phosphoglucosamine mutase [archaeon]